MFWLLLNVFVLRFVLIPLRRFDMRRYILLICCVIALLTTSVNASEWLGTTSTDWMDADNWDTAYAPDVSVMVHAYIQNENPCVLGLGDTL